jgi:hypothetical protein
MQTLLQGKAISVTYSEFMSIALLIQHEIHMRHIVIYGCRPLQYFSTLSHKSKDFREKSC